MPTNKPKIILAGSYAQFRMWQKSNPNESGYYADSAHKLAGLEASGIEKVGTFWERGDAIEFYEIARTRVR